MKDREGGTSSGRVTDGRRAEANHRILKSLWGESFPLRGDWGLPGAFEQAGAEEAAARGACLMDAREHNGKGGRRRGESFLRL